jgi:hypothetical protein
MPHFTDRWSPGSVLAASASIDSAMPRCGSGRLAMYARTGLSPTAAFAGLARPVMASGSAKAASAFAASLLVMGSIIHALAHDPKQPIGC